MRAYQAVIERFIQESGTLFRQPEQFRRCLYATHAEILCRLLLDIDNHETGEFRFRIPFDLYKQVRYALV